MKTLVRSSILFCLLSGSASYAQTYWTVGSTEVAAPDLPQIGTSNGVPLQFITGGEERAKIDENGLFSVKNLEGTGTRLVVIDENGNFGPADAPVGGYQQLPCTPGSLPWYLNGNIINGSGNNLIGTCNAKNFILMANSKQSINMSATNGYVGVGENNSSPTAPLDVKDPSSNNWMNAHTRIYGNDEGAIESDRGMQLHYDATGSGMGFAIVEGPVGNWSNPTRLLISGGKVGIGTTSLPAKLTVVENDALGLTHGNNKMISSMQANVQMGNLTKVNTWAVRDNTFNTNNNWTSAKIHNGISVDGSFLTPGTDTRTWWERNPHQDIQAWGTGSTTYMALEGNKLRIGPGRPKIGGVAQNALLSVDGMILAREIRVAISTTTHWQDFVFEPDYKLMPLDDVARYVKANKHLPQVPSEAEVRKNGVDLVEMNGHLLQKVEELYLYTIELNNKVNALEEQQRDRKK